MMYKTILSLSVAIGLVQPAYALDLQMAYQLAVENDSSYTAALQTYEAAKLDLPLARASSKPNVSLTGAVIQNHDSIDPDGSPSSSANYLQSQLALNVNHELYNKATQHSISQAELVVDIAKLQLVLAKEALIGSTVERYLGVLSALDNQKLAELEQAAIEKQLELATQRLEVGLGTKTDQYDAQARFESSKAGLIAAQNEVLNAGQSLEILINTTLPENLRAEIKSLDNQKVSLMIDDSNEWILQSVEQAPVYLIQQKQVQLKQIELATAVESRSPILSLVAGVSAAESSGGLQSSGGSGQNNWNVGLQGSLPLYQGGAIKLREIKAGYSLNSAKLELEKTRRESDLAIRSARRGVHALEKQVQALDQAVRASDSALKSKVEGFKAGVTTNIDVLDGQRDLFRARRDYLKSSYDLVNAVIGLERSAGALNEQDINLVNGWLKR